MEKKHFNEVLDYGLFDEVNDLDLDLSQLPLEDLRKKYKYYTKVKTKTGQVLLFLSMHSSMRPNVGDIGFSNKERLPDGKYPLSSEEWIIVIENGVVKHWLREEHIKVNELKKPVVVETIFPYGMQIGNEIFSNGQPLEDGKYSRGWRQPVIVEDGKIVDKEILSKEFGVELIFCQHDANGEINYNHLVGAIKESTPKGKTLVSIMHANNEIGVINDIQRIGLLCQENGALFHSDMVQTIGHLDVSLSNFNIDFASLSAHKFHGPKGNGALYIKSEVSIDPIIIGGGQERNMRAGTEDVAGIVGLAKALSLAIEDQEKEDKHCNALKLLCFDLLKESINEVSLSTNNKESLSRVLNVVFPVNPKTEMLQMALDIKGFAVSGGSACSSGALGGSHVIQHLHSSPCVPLRISFSKWNTKGEVEKLVKTIKELLN
jgi:cysteine desulfurase